MEDNLAQRIRKLNQFIQRIGIDDLENKSVKSAVLEITQFLPEVVSFPDVTRVRIVINENEITQEKFKQSAEIRCAPIVVGQAEVGEVAFHYHFKKPSSVTIEALDDDQVMIETLSEQIAFLITLINRNSEIRYFKDQAMTAYDRTIEAWAAAFDTQQKEASGHIDRVVNLALALASEMGFEGEDLDHIRRGALLHDIGKITVPDEIISKPGKLTDAEFKIVQQHPNFAMKWLADIELLKPALLIPYYHHEKWDGSGYPQGLAGEDIPLVARMFSVVDVWDALISDRPYRQALNKDEALSIIVSQSGSHFDPKVVDSFIKVLSDGKYFENTTKIRIQAFGQERVWVHNRLITNRDWQVRAAHDIFFLILAHPLGLSKEQVGLYSWPDISLSDLDVRFKNTLYRVRRALGKDVIILEDGRYRFNPILDYTFDVEIFRTAIERAQESDNARQKITNLNLAINQYKGGYLPECDETWAIMDREHYAKIYQNALIELAALNLDAGNEKLALSFCIKALAEDPIDEEAHRLTMKVYATSGKIGEIVHQYEDCKQALMDTLGVLPSEKTRLLYEGLIQQQSSGLKT